MNTLPRLRPAVHAARARLAEGREKLKLQHQSGSPGIQVCARMTDVVDGVLRELFDDALATLGDDRVATLADEAALIAHGGYGRRDVAPYSDVDLMLLCTGRVQSRMAPLARRLTQHVFDAGLQLGFSLRTPAQACSLAWRDATVFCSLSDARWLGGSEELFARFAARFRRGALRRTSSLLGQIEHARRQERRQFGETVYLLEPNVKRSRGGLRDIQLLRWTGMARYGLANPEHLYRAGFLLQEDHRKLRRAREFLLRLRNELHFHAGKTYDVLDRGEQVRIAGSFGYAASAALLPVEHFMRDYFEHTSNVRYIAANFLADAQNRKGLLAYLAPLVSHQVEGDFRVGPRHIGATRRGMKKVCGDLAEVLRLMDLANRYDKRIDHATWQAIRQAMTDGAVPELSREARQRFLSLMSQPGALGDELRRLHQLRVLEKLVPPMAHSRCLMQFNEYHKYTVDEHSIRAVERATDFLSDSSLVGEIYRGIKQKGVLHLALLMHDMGKGYTDDHSEMGLRLAAESAEHLGLGPRDTETLSFLVHKHLLMSHLALWRNIDDEAVAVQLAVEVGSPEMLQMLFVLTCADLAAVGPGVLNQWKRKLISDLYQRTMQQVAGEAAPDADERLRRTRQELRGRIADDHHADWWDKQIAALPASLLDGEGDRVLADLERLKNLPRREAEAWGRYDPVRHTVEYTVGTYEDIAPGIFHRLTGCLSSKGLQILSAEIHTLADSLVLDRFHVNDPDYSGEPPAHRLTDVSQALVAALKDGSGKSPVFRRTWQPRSPAPAGKLPTRVRIDNSTSDRFTIIDVFAHDRLGLLYAITRSLFELGLSVGSAKIGTRVDQVVDVFYVTDQAGRKIEDEERLVQIRDRLLQAIGQVEGA